MIRAEIAAVAPNGRIIGTCHMAHEDWRCIVAEYNRVIRIEIAPYWMPTMPTMQVELSGREPDDPDADDLVRLDAALYGLAVAWGMAPAEPGCSEGENGRAT